MKQCILFLLLCSSIATFSQTAEDKSTWILKGNVTSLIDIFTFPTVQLSVEKKLTKCFSVNAEIGYQFFDFHRTDTILIKPKGFKVNIELRCYVSKLIDTDLAKKLDGFYLGLQPFFRQNQYSAGVSYHASSDSLQYMVDNMGVKKTVYGLNGILGFQKPISGKVILDLYIGIGIMNRNVRNTNREYNKDSDERLMGTDLGPLFQYLNLSESSGLAGNVLFGIRIGYKL